MFLGMSKRRWCEALFTGVLITLALVGRAAANEPAAAAPTETGGYQDAGYPAHAPPQAGAEMADADAEGYVDADPAAVEHFRPVLEPYGAWVDDRTYGLVWVPRGEVVGPNFVPYVTAGHWEMTAEGDWLWVSDYEWGWAAFHYGRWVWIPGRGWGWVAGRRYAPAWVVWRVGEPGYTYVGWAPMPPEYYWYGGVAVAVWVSPPPYYAYCHSHHVLQPHVHRHVISGHHAHGIAGRTHTYQPPSPRAGRHAAAPRWKGPNPAEAGVPAQAVPRTPARPDPRALSAAKLSHTAGSPGLRAVPRTSALGPGRAPGPRETGRASRATGVGAPVYRGAPAYWVPVDKRGRALAPAPAAASDRAIKGTRTLRASRPDSPGARSVPSLTRRRAGWTESASAGARRIPVPQATPPRAGGSHQLPSPSPVPTYRGNRWGGSRRSVAPPPHAPTDRAPSAPPTYRTPRSSPSQVRPSPSPVVRGAPQGSGGSKGNNKQGRGRATGKIRGSGRR
jgi:hypothetical protein